MRVSTIYLLYSVSNHHPIINQSSFNHHPIIIIHSFSRLPCWETRSKTGCGIIPSPSTPIHDTDTDINTNTDTHARAMPNVHVPPSPVSSSTATPFINYWGIGICTGIPHPKSNHQEFRRLHQCQSHPARAEARA